MSSFWRTPANTRINFILPETRLPKLYDSCYSMGLPVFTFTQFFESQEKMFKTSVNARPHCHLTSSFREPERISAQTLYCQKLESLPKICAADSVCPSLLVFAELFFENRPVGASQTGAKTI